MSRKGILRLEPSEPQPETTDNARRGEARAHILLTDDALVARDLGRYLFILVTYLRLSGYSAVLYGRSDLGTRIEAQKWAGRLLKDAGVHLNGGSTDPVPAGADDIVLHSGDIATGQFAGLKHFQLIKGRRLTRQPADYDVLFPYMLHPKYYTDGRYLKVSGYRSKSRNIGLFFSGNYDERYSNPAIFEKYGTLQRTAILDLLLDRLPADRIFRTSSEFASELETQNLQTQFVFVDNLKGTRVAKGRWLETLAQCRFFLACPGVDMPLAHNLVEAMSVGCVPLTQCGDFFDPPLRDGHECIAHSGDDVVEKAQTVLSMDPSQIERLRANVIAYYERYLSVDAFRRRVLEHPGQTVRVGMNFMPVEGVR